MMPEMQASADALISAILFFTFTDAVCMRFLVSMTMIKNTGIRQVTRSASRHSIRYMKKSAPIMVSPEITRSSGPWCDSSVISNRSPVSLLIRLPVRLWS